MHPRIIRACFSLSLGLFFGSVFNTLSTASAVLGFVSIIFILGAIFIGQLRQISGNGPVLVIAMLLPTYYLADGVVNGSQNLGTWSAHVFDIGIILLSMVILLAISGWSLRRQSAVLAVT